MLRVLGLLCRVLRLRFVPTITILLLALGVAGPAFASTCTVSSKLDSGPGTLRSCISGASSGDTIDFSVTGTITLGSALPTISQDLTITGPGANLLTVSGNNLYQVFNISSGTVTISGLTIANGKGSGSYAAGGIADDSSGTVIVSGCAFFANSAAGAYAGGAISGDYASPERGILKINGSTFMGNSGSGGAYAAGAISAPFVTATVIDSTFSGNSASGTYSAGAISTTNSGTVTVTNSTFSGNSAAGVNASGAISAVNSSLDVENSILTGDTSGECYGGGCPSNGSDGNIVGVAANLLPLGNYGGPTQTFLPLPGSPAICAGSASSVPVDVTTDQRGFPLSSSNCSNGGVDAGAVQSNYLMVTTNADSGTGSLRAAINTANSAGSGDIAFSTSLFNSTSTAAQTTITLASALPALTGQINIVGPGALPGGSSANAIVSGNNSTAVGSVFTVNSGAEVLLDGLTIANGNALNNGGGGISNEGTLTVMDSTISDNTSAANGPVPGNGGGIFNQGALTVMDSTISGNTAAAGDGGQSGDGGGIYNHGTLVVTNSTITGNTAAGSPGQAGGIWNLGGGGTLTATNSTISGNTTDGSTDILNDEGGMTLANSILGTCIGTVCPANGDNNNVAGVATAQLNLGPLSNNGGPTQTLLPLPGSAAICAGSSSLFVGPTGTLLTTDQRGATHSAAYCAAGQVDAGAVQTDYTSIQFTNARAAGPTGEAYIAAVSTAPNPAPIVSVTEDGQNIGGIAVTLTDTGLGGSTVTGLGPVSTLAGTGATFSSLEDSVAEDTTLSSTLAITSSYSLTTNPNAIFSVLPSITGITPDSGPSAGGTAVTITGTGFGPGAQVQFGGANATNVVVVNSNTLTAITPAGTGPASVQVFSGGASDPFNFFTYIAPLFSPANSTLSASPTTLVVGSVATITATAIDTSGAPISGATVDFSFGGITATTDSSGIATFGLNSISPATFFVGATLVNPAGTFAQTAQVTFVAPAYVVTTLADDATGVASNCVDPNVSTSGNGNCSLRDAISAANALTGVNTAISFAGNLGSVASPGKITLLNGPLTLTANATITGLGTTALVVDGNQNGNILDVNTGVTASVEDMTLQNALGIGSQMGGAIDNAGTLSLTGVLIQGSKPTNFSGGAGIYNTGTLSVTGSTITGNSSSYFGGTSGVGGGIYSSGGTLAITSSTIANNAASLTGGNVYTSGGAVVIDNSTITGSSGTQNGGGLSVGGGTVTVTDSTIAYNNAGSNPGVLIGGGTVTVKNSIVAANGGSNTSTGNCSGCTLTDNNVVDANPLLAVLGSYGGTTQTLVPLPGSPAICTGATAGDALDQRGYARPAGACYDIGAAQTQYTISFTGQPANGIINTALTTTPSGPVTVQILDHGNGIPGALIPLTLQGNGSLNGATSETTDTTGTATYSSLTVSAPGTADTLTAVASSTEVAPLSVVSNSFNVLDVSTQLGFGVPPAATVALNGNAGGAITVKEEDVSGDIVTTATDSITLTVTGPDSYTEIYTATAASGVATFNLSGAALNSAGQYTYTASFGTLTSAIATETVLQAGTTTTLTASSGSINPNQTVTLTATVTSTAIGTPTGTVTFSANGTELLTVAMNNGVAQLTTALPPGASYTITAVYSGDGNFLTSTSTNSASVTVAPLDFTFTDTGTSAYTAAPGAIASYSFALSPLYGSYAGPVSFTVTGLPAGATASFTPSAVAANTNGTTPVTMTVQTAAATAHNNSNPFGRGAIFALLLLPFGIKRSIRKKLKGRMLLLVLLMAGLTATLTGCGSNNGFMLQSPGAYTLTVTATAGTLTHSQTVTLIVQ